MNYSSIQVYKLHWTIWKTRKTILFVFQRWDLFYPAGLTIRNYMIRFLMFQTDVVLYDCYHKLTLFRVNSINESRPVLRNKRDNRISFTLFENKKDDDHVNLYLYTHSLYIDLSRLVVWDRPRQLRPSHTNSLYYYYYFVLFLFVFCFCRFSFLV